MRSFSPTGTRNTHHTADAPKPDREALDKFEEELYLPTSEEDRANREVLERFWERESQAASRGLRLCSRCDREYSVGLAFCPRHEDEDWDLGYYMGR